MHPAMCIPHLPAILLLVILSSLSVNGQTVDFPLEEWNDKLSERHDPASLQLQHVITQIGNVDSMSRCQALNKLMQLATHKNTRMQIRSALVLAEIGKSNPHCTNIDEREEVLKTALQRCYELPDYELAAAVHIELGNIYDVLEQDGLSITHTLLAKELMEKEGLHLFTRYAFMLHILANRLYRSRDYHAAVDIARQAIVYHGSGDLNKSDSLNRYWMMNNWNTLGLCYLRLAEYDSAFHAFNQAYVFAETPFWRGLILGNRGDVFFFQERYDSAEVWLQVDYRQSLSSKEYHNAALTLARLARITHARGDYQKALAMVREADALERKNPLEDYRVQIYYTYALIYRDLGKADSAFAYMELCKTMSEKIERHASDNRAEIILLQLDNQENIHAIQALVKDKKRIQVIRNFMILLLMVLASTGYLYLNRIRLRNKLKQQEALEAKRQAEAQAAHAREQLETFTHNLREKTNLIENLQEQLLHRETNEEQIRHITELSHHVILTDEDWERFKFLFDSVYPGFLHNLKRKSSDITVAELRMAALCKLQLGIKECASILGISPNSVHKTRYRLKQRLGLEQDADLESFIVSTDAITAR